MTNMPHDSQVAQQPSTDRLPPGVLKIALVVIIGAIMSILDTTIVNVAIDSLRIDFHTSLASIQWVSTGYMLALATVIPLTGWAADRFGPSRVWIWSVVMFAVGSALSGTAWSASSLIAFRVLQGLGGGMIMPAGMIIMARAAGPSRIGRVMSIVGVPMLLGPILGPVIGGYLVDGPGWRWIFYVNIPIAVIAVILGLRILPKVDAQRHLSLDLLGVALLSPGVALLTYGLAVTGERGGFATPRAIAPTLAGLALTLLFVLHAMRAKDSLIDVGLFRQRSFVAAAGTTMLFGAGFFGSMLLVPLYYQIIRGDSAFATGLYMVPQGIGAAMMMPISGRIVDRAGSARIVLLGLALVTVGTWGWTQVAADTHHWTLGMWLFVRGLGMGATMMPAMAAAYQSLDRVAIARATSALNIIQRTGGALGTAILAVVLQRNSQHAIAQTLSHRLPIGAGSGAAHTSGSQAPSLTTGASLPHFLAGPVSGAFGTAFWWATALSLVAVLPALLLPFHKPVHPEE